MTKQIQVLFCLFVFVCVIGPVFGVDTAEIARIQQKAQNQEVLTTQDIRLMRDFLETAVGELMQTETFQEAVAARTAIVAYSGGVEVNQYSAAYAEEALPLLREALAGVENWEGGKEKRTMQRHLLVAIASLGSPEVLPVVEPFLNHENAILRYWGVKAIANEEIANILESATLGSPQVIRQILGRLRDVAQRETHDEILHLIVSFAGMLDAEPAGELLVELADLRIESYMSWEVDYELMDMDLLKALATRIQSQESEQEKNMTARKFAQLYSAVMQRYIKGWTVLSEMSKDYLASVMVEIEQNVLPRLMGRRQAGIKNAIERGNFDQLRQEHDQLFGTATSGGNLTYELGFNYGEDPQGRPLTGPKQIPAPPETSS